MLNDLLIYKMRSLVNYLLNIRGLIMNKQESIQLVKRAIATISAIRLHEFTSEEIASLVIASRALDNNPKQLTAVMMECLNLVQISDLNEEDVLPLHNLIKVYNS